MFVFFPCAPYTKKPFSNVRTKKKVRAVVLAPPKRKKEKRGKGRSTKLLVGRDREVRGIPRKEKRWLRKGEELEGEGARNHRKGIVRNVTENALRQIGRNVIIATNGIIYIASPKI